MSRSPNYVEMRFPSLPENVAFARTAVAIFASQLEFNLDELDEIKVAVSEAVSNSVIHGYKETVGEIRVSMKIEGEELIVTVEDDGSGIDDLEWAKQPTHTSLPEERMGLGLVFINEYMSGVQIESKVNEGTRVRMSKRPAIQRSLQDVNVNS